MIRKLVKSSIIAMAMLFVGTVASAQSKVGYINFEQLVSLMPESMAAANQVDSYRKAFDTQVSSKATEIDGKSKLLEEKRGTLDEATRQTAEQEIQMLNQNLQQLQATAQRSVQAKIVELRQPIWDKAKMAIADVAAEKGYTLVLNLNQTDVIVGAATDDLLSAVKIKLNIQ